jgi:hypothetical protein
LGLVTQFLLVCTPQSREVIGFLEVKGYRNSILEYRRKWQAVVFRKSVHLTGKNGGSLIVCFLAVLGTRPRARQML